MSEDKEVEEALIFLLNPPSYLFHIILPLRRPIRLLKGGNYGNSNYITLIKDFYSFL
jgi:hypothetical protein